jgi:hypothetical protein
MGDDCDDFYLVNLGDTCTNIVAEKGITISQFKTWNKGVSLDCMNLWEGVFVCTSVIGHSPTPTNPDNGITTPLPIQPGMIPDCDAFYFVHAGDSCAVIAAINGLSVSQFTTWNRGVSTTCSNLWADVYVYVSIVGHNPTHTTPNPGNGIQTPSPVQNHIAKLCKKFHFL